MSEEAPAEDAEQLKLKLQVQIDELERWMESKPTKDFQASVAEDIDAALQRLTTVPPETIGQLTAHFADIGRLAAFRVLKSQPAEALADLKNRLKEL